MARWPDIFFISMRKSLNIYIRQANNVANWPIDIYRQILTQTAFNFKEVGVVSKNKKKVGFWVILWNLILTSVTGGLWLVWLLIKYLKKNS